ncbi:hypothetical protein ABK040_012457 [Willaertia magna]
MSNQFDKLMKWCQHKVKDYPCIQFTNFQCQSIQNGLLFVGLLHHYFPDKITNPNDLNPLNEKENRELAWNFAHKDLGIIDYYELDDFNNTKKIEPKTMKMHILEYYNYLSKLKEPSIGLYEPEDEANDDRDNVDSLAIVSDNSGDKSVMDDNSKDDVIDKTKEVVHKEEEKKVEKVKEVVPTTTVKSQNETPSVMVVSDVQVVEMKPKKKEEETIKQKEEEEKKENPKAPVIIEEVKIIEKKKEEKVPSSSIEKKVVESTTTVTPTSSETVVKKNDSVVKTTTTSTTTKPVATTTTSQTTTVGTTTLIENKGQQQPQLLNMQIPLYLTIILVVLLFIFNRILGL